MRLQTYINEVWTISDFDRENAEKSKSYHHKTLVSFKKDVEKYNIPKGYKHYIYDVALEQLDDYFKGKLSHIDIFMNPDNKLRNAMKQWYFDKKRLKKI